MTVIVSAMGLLMLSLVLFCERMGSEGRVPGAVDEGRGLLHLAKRAAVPQHTETTESTTYTCENHQILLWCPASHVIRVRTAVYGRTSPSVCNPRSRNFSDHILESCISNVLDKVNTQCDGQKRCQFRATNRILGDPCPEIGKFLVVNYACREIGPAPWQFAYACEDNNLLLGCPWNEQLVIHNASYGRMSNCKACVFGINSNCNDSCILNVTHFVSSKCRGEMKCWVEVSNNAFTDPCVNIYKYLEVNYRCQ